jgi:uncharacterized protein involved in exopolysaccharide biosynthesis
VEIPPGDVVVSVTVSAREAALAAKLANAMADEMLAEVDRGREESRRAETVKLESALQQLRTEIEKIQREEKPDS